MTYDQIKEQYPLGCEVELFPVDTNGKFTRGKSPAAGCFIPRGKILAVLDPDRHGPKCLLFKIDKPKGAKVSNESNFSTIVRKLSAFKRPVVGISVTVPNPMKGKVHNYFSCRYGQLKWIKPSDIKRGVDNGLSEDEYHKEMTKQMSRTELKANKELHIKREHLKETMRDLELSKEDKALLEAIFDGGTVRALEKEIEEENKYCTDMKHEKIDDKKLGDVGFVRSDHLFISSDYEVEKTVQSNGATKIYFKRKDQ